MVGWYDKAKDSLLGSCVPFAQFNRFLDFYRFPAFIIISYQLYELGPNIHYGIRRY